MTGRNSVRDIMDLDKICRTCMGLSGPLLSIYEGSSASGNGSCIADMLTEVTKIRPRKGDKLPEKVCLSCISEINHCYSYKLKCENSNRTLRHLLPDAIPEDSYALKKVVLMVDKNIQTLEDFKKKKTKSIEIQTDIIELHRQTVANKEERGKPSKILETEEIITVPNEIHNIKIERAETVRQLHVDNSPKHLFKQEANIKNQAGKKRLLNSANSNEVIECSNVRTQPSEFYYDSNYEYLEEYVLEEVNTSKENEGKSEEMDQDDTHENYYQQDNSDEIETQNYIYDTASSDNQATVELDDDDDDSRVEYNISICNDECNETDEIKSLKVDENTNKKNFKCPHCFMEFVSCKNLNKHINKRHSVSIVKKQDTSHNMKSEDSIEIGNFREPDKEQPKGIRRNSNKRTSGKVMKLELDIAPPEPTIIEEEQKPMLYSCAYCNASFALRKSLAYHQRLSACTLKSFSCSECGRMFMSEQKMMEHKSTHILSHNCNECTKVFPSNEELNNHMIDDHGRKHRNQCNVCFKVFTMLSTLRDHMRIHTGEKPFLCMICSKSFTQAANLRQHMLRHNEEKRFKCDECPKSYCTKAEYYSHKRTHTGDQPFKCDFCDARFTTSSSMNKHRRKHTGERPYACDMCPMRFASLNVMKNHRRTHTGEKPFKCSFCTRVFTQKGDCQAHQRLHMLPAKLEPKREKALTQSQSTDGDLQEQEITVEDGEVCDNEVVLMELDIE